MLIQRFDKKFKYEPEILMDKKKSICMILNYSIWHFFSAETWQDQSARGSEEYVEYSGHQSINWKERGYSTILEILMVGHVLNN